MDPDFSQALEKIPAQLRDERFRFVPILNGRKKPEGKSWSTDANYPCDHAVLAGYLAEGHNYGVLTGMGGLVVVDIDDPDALNELGVLSRIPGTFTVKTGRGGYHFYFDCPELDHQIGIYHPTLKDPDNKNEPLHLGEIQSTGQQVVGPGSRHPNGNKYEPINDAPILSISKADVFKLLDGLILTGVDDPAEEPRRAEARRRSSGGSSLGDLIPIDQVAWPKDIKERTGAEVRGSHPLHGSTTGKNFSINTAKNCWHCFRHNTGGGPLEWLAVEAGLIRCEDAKPGCLSNGLFKKVLKIARDRGFNIPNGPTVIDAIRALDSVCDKATSKDGCGFSRFDREEHSDLIDKAINEGTLDPKEEKAAYRFIKKYTKQLNKLGIEFDDIGHIAREDGDVLAKINDRIPVWIEEHHFKTVADTEKLYHYAHGVYLDDGETILKTIIEQEFGDISDNRMVSDVIGKVKRRTYIDRELFNNGPILNVQNGLLNLETLELKPHTPDYLSTSQISVTYNKEATAPKIRKFLNEVAKPGDIALIEEIIGWLLWPDYNVHKAIMFIGPGRNGKGTLLRLITAFLGKKSVSNVTLQDLVADRFAKADLYGKLANIGGDLPSKDLSDTAAFRNLTGGDDNRAQEKYRAAFNFRNKAKMLFSANVLPRSPDDTYAFYSRWILLEFLKVFDPQKGTGDPDLDAKLQTPEELSGLLNIALAGLARLRANGWKFSYDKTVEDVEVMYKRNANPVYAFLIDECEPGEATDYIEKTLFYNAFRNYAQAHGIRPLSSKKFSELLIDQTEVPVSTFRPFVEYGNRPMCWQGVKFKDHATVCQSRMSRILPTPILRQNEIESSGEEKEGEIGIKKTLDILDCGALVDGPSAGDTAAQDAIQNQHFADMADRIADNSGRPETGLLGGGAQEPLQSVVSVRFKTDYCADWPGPDGKRIMRQFKEGEIAEVPADRAVGWIRRNVAKVVA